MRIKKQISNESENSAPFDRWIIDITELQWGSEKEFFKEPSIRKFIRRASAWVWEIKNSWLIQVWKTVTFSCFLFLYDLLGLASKKKVQPKNNLQCVGKFFADFRNSSLKKKILNQGLLTCFLLNSLFAEEDHGMLQKC